MTLKIGALTGGWAIAWAVAVGSILICGAGAYLSYRRFLNQMPPDRRKRYRSKARRAMSIW